MSLYSPKDTILANDLKNEILKDRSVSAFLQLIPMNIFDHNDMEKFYNYILNEPKPLFHSHHSTLSNLLSAGDINHYKLTKSNFMTLSLNVGLLYEKKLIKNLERFPQIIDELTDEDLVNIAKRYELNILEVILNNYNPSQELLYDIATIVANSPMYGTDSFYEFLEHRFGINIKPYIEIIEKRDREMEERKREREMEKIREEKMREEKKISRNKLYEVLRYYHVQHIDQIINDVFE